MPSKKPLSDAELKAWESSRDIGAELEQSIREMLAGKGTDVPVSPGGSAHEIGVISTPVQGRDYFHARLSLQS